MKQKFFTFLAMLMFVSVNALAQEKTTQPVSISAKYGATTFVCDQDLDFSDFCSDPQHIVMKPYYISGYSKEDGTFTLSAFVGATVPAYTPMILLGTAHTSAGETDVIREEVPVISMNSSAADDKRDLAFGAAGGYCWLEPAIASSFTIPDYVAKEAGRGSLDKMDVTFYDNTSKSFPLYVKQTGVVEFGSTKTYTYYPKHRLSDTSYLKLATKSRIDQSEAMYPGELVVDKRVVLWAYEDDEYPEEGGVIYAVYRYRTTGGGRWVYYSSADPDAANYDSTRETWYDAANEITEPAYRNVTNFVLSVNNSTGKPVFKKCNSSSNGGAGTTVAAGKCYVRVWNDVLVGAAAAREDIGWTFEEEEDLNSFEENATGIKDVKSIKNKKEIFNMKGQKLEKMQKGLNIVNGKKVYVK